MKHVFTPEARVELNQAVDYYENCEAGLGLEFLEEVYATIQRIIEFPTAWSHLSQRTRRCLTDRFPFAVIYQAKQDRILIVAITHLARKPGYWKDRF